MEQENWVESEWIKGMLLKKKLPFEDTIFVELYRAILLRNVEFCQVVTVEDKQVHSSSYKLRFWSSK